MRRLTLYFLPTLFIIFAFSFIALAQADAVHSPAAKSTERQAILDALRGSENVMYQVNFIKVHNGWAWVDTTPLDPKTKQATAEGGPNLLHLANGRWKVMDLSKVPEDKKDPLGAEDASPTYVRNVQRTFKGCPADIFLSHPDNRLPARPRINHRTFVPGLIDGSHAKEIIVLRHFFECVSRYVTDKL